MSMTIGITTTCDNCGAAQVTRGSPLGFPNGYHPRGWWHVTGAIDCFFCPECAADLPVYRPYHDNAPGTYRLPDTEGHTEPAGPLIRPRVMA